MTEEVFWVWQVEITGPPEEFEALMEEMIAAAQANEPGAVVYEWYFSEDKKTCHVLERYADSAAVLAHLGNVGAYFMKSFRGRLKQTAFTVYGAPDEAARKALVRAGAVIMAPAAGFSR